jgi:hypothetical protein
VAIFCFSAPVVSPTLAVRAQDLVRPVFLDEVTDNWSQLDPEHFPFTRSMAGQLRTPDDRDDFLAGLDLILSGIGALVPA